VQLRDRDFQAVAAVRDKFWYAINITKQTIQKEVRSLSGKIIINSKLLVLVAYLPHRVRNCRRILHQQSVIFGIQVSSKFGVMAVSWLGIIVPRYASCSCIPAKIRKSSIRLFRILYHSFCEITAQSFTKGCASTTNTSSSVIPCA